MEHDGKPHQEEAEKATFQKLLKEFHAKYPKATEGLLKEAMEWFNRAQS